LTFGKTAYILLFGQITMNKKQKLIFESQAGIMKALAHATRLFIVNRLSSKELCVNEITEMIGDDTSTISKHLSILKNAGLVEDEKRGTSVYYKLKCPCVLNFFSCVQSVQKERLKEQMKTI
jgi:ArsR family transcriptional regulator